LAKVLFEETGFFYDLAEARSKKQEAIKSMVADIRNPLNFWGGWYNRKKGYDRVSL
jgi:hypothetical protein